MLEGLYEAMQAAEDALAAMPELADKKAQTDRIYREAKSKRILYERVNNNTPVSIVQDVVKGYTDIAQLKVEQECAEALYQANYESLLWNKKKVDLFRELIAREYVGGYRDE